MTPAHADVVRGSALTRNVSFLLTRASVVAAQRDNEALAPLGLKVRSFSVLGLALDDQPPTQREIAEFLRLDPSQVVALVDDLEQRGLLARETDPRDRRAKVVAATPAVDITAGVDEHEAETLRRALAKLAFEA